MKEKPSEIINETMTGISLSVYGAINIVRPMLDNVDEEGNVTIPADDFRSLLDLLAMKDAGPVNEEVLKESIYARLRYRQFLVNALNHSGLVPNKLVTFIAGDTVVGIIRGGKIMGSVFPKPTDANQAFDGSIIDRISKEGKIYLDPDKFMTGAGTHGVITPCGMYLYCKAGDGLISVWTHLMLNRGCKRDNRLTILDDDGRSLYEFRYELCDDETPGEIVHVDQYELHPRMRFNEYYCYR